METGKPYLFVGNNISCWHDPSHPGHLRLLKGVYPLLGVRQENDRVHFQMGTTFDAAKTDVTFDISSLLADPRGLIMRRYDVLRECLLVARDEGNVNVSLHRLSGTDPYPISKLRYADAAGRIVEIDDIFTGPRGENYLFSVTEERIRASGIPLEVVTPDTADVANKFPMSGDPNIDQDLLDRFLALFSKER